MAIFGAVLLAVAISTWLVNQEIERLARQEEIAARIDRCAHELEYTAIPCLLAQEDQQRQEWDAQWDALAAELAQLTPGNAREQQLVDSLRSHHRHLREVFTSAAPAAAGGPQPGAASCCRPLIRDSWARMAAQNRAMATGAGQFFMSVHERRDRLTETRSMLYIALAAILGAYSLATYLTVQRRLLRGVADLLAGARMVGSGNLDFAVGAERDDEVGDLVRAFNRMTAQLREVTASRGELEREIAERQRTEEELAASEERFRAVFELSSDCILVWDRDGNYLYANQAAIDHVGTTRDKVIGRNIRDGLGHIPDFLHLWLARLEQAFATGEPFRVEDSVPVAGRLVHSESQISPIRDAAGQMFAVSVVYRDVTERKQVMEALRDSEQRLRMATGAAGMFAWDCDLPRGTIRWSENAAAIIGCQAEELPERMADGRFFLAPEDALRITADFARAAAAQQPRYTTDFRGCGEPEAAKHYSMHARILYDPGGQPVRVMGVTQDITERKRSEELLRKSHQALAQLLEERTRQVREKEVLLKEVHHRVKNNLQVISSLVSLQADEAADEAVRASLADVTNRVRSMALVHEKIYQSSDLARIDFADYIRSLLGYLWRAHGAAAAQVHLRLDLAPVLLPVVTAVPCGLIVNELADNALKHAFRGRTGGEVAVSFQEHDGRISLSVQDNGVGFPPGFDWQRARSLGLRLVHMLAGQLRAEVTMHAGGGAGLRISFPQVAGPRPDAGL
ncbi:MAG: histidine kinase dimerization/phosphoacceptor domain -containing protein [Thermodesulfobacteriota bacterium]